MCRLQHRESGETLSYFLDRSRRGICLLRRGAGFFWRELFVVCCWPVPAKCSFAEERVGRGGGRDCDLCTLTRDEESILMTTVGS